MKALYNSTGFRLTKTEYDRILDQMQFAAPALHAGSNSKDGTYLLRRRFLEDWRQMVCEVALMAEQDNVQHETNGQFHGYFHSYFYRQMKNYGFTRWKDNTGECCGGWTGKDVALGLRGDTPFHEDGRHLKIYPTCGIPGCTARKVYNDERYGALCRKHGAVVVKRRKRNWPDPYLGLETAKVSVGSKYLPKENRKFWSLVRMFVSDEEWIAMWEWAKGRNPNIDRKILEKARVAIQSAELQPKG